MPNPATVADIEARWRPLTPAESINASAFLDDAWSLLLTRRPALEVHMTTDAVSSGAVIAVVSAMVLRVLRNPEGYIDESVDDWRGRRSELVASGALTVTEAELGHLTPIASSYGAVGSTLTYGAPDTIGLPLNWWELNL